MLAYRDQEPTGRLSNEQQQEILVMFDDILRGKREAVQSQLNRGCNGVKEAFLVKEFLFKDNS